MELLETPPCDPYTWGEHPVIVIEMYNLREIRIELDPSAAPITVAYFLKLVSEGFYDWTRFHRVIPNFMIQGGDPTGTGDGETEFYVKGEFADNGILNPISHTRGTIALARQEGNDTASCQFFIMLIDAPSMDGQYATFGHVISGMDAVDQIAAFPTNENAAPVIPLIMQRVYIETEGD